MDFKRVHLLRSLALVAALWTPAVLPAAAQTNAPSSSAPSAKPAPATPAPSTPVTKLAPSATPAPAIPSPSTPAATPSPAPDKVPDAKAPETKTPEPKAAEPGSGKPHDTEIEPHGSPGIPQNATTESVDVPALPAVIVAGQSSYDDAFKSIKASLDTVKAAMNKAGVKPAGHPITIFSEPDEKGFKYRLAVPVAAKPDKTDLGAGVTIGTTPSGKAIKFQHRGAYEDIDSTYDVITAYLDAKGLQVENPYIEEYLTDLTTSDDPNLQVDIYVFVK